MLEAAVRSWPPVEPICLRWNFPVWTRDGSLDPAALKADWPRRRAKKAETEPQPSAPEWTVERFVETFTTAEPQEQAAILGRAKEEGLSNRKAKELHKTAEVGGLVHRWVYGPRTPVGFATSPQSEDAK